MAYNDEACIVGVGTTELFAFDLGKSPLTLQTEAFEASLRDAGLDKSQIDGFGTADGGPSGVDYDEFIFATGLDCRWATQMWNHGRWATTLIAQAALVVAAGLANYVAIANTAMAPRGYARHLRGMGGGGPRSGLRDMGAGHGSWDIHGTDTPGAATALVAQRYMDQYGASEKDLARIVVGSRQHAVRNPLAVLAHKQLTEGDYFDEPRIAGPLRRSDFSLTNDGSTSLVVTTLARARDLDCKPVRIRGIEGIRTSRDDSILFARPGLGIGFGSEHDFVAAPEIYRTADVDRSDVGALYIYDAFSCNVWMTLERFGFCPEGEAAAYLREAGMDAPDLPINTNGGLIAEGHLSGYAHVVEMVRQVRGVAGERQVSRNEVVQWATPWGDSLILTA